MYAVFINTNIQSMLVRNLIRCNNNRILIIKKQEQIFHFLHKGVEHKIIKTINKFLMIIDYRL